MLCFPEAIDVLRWKASWNGKKHLTEGEARELGIPTAMQKQTAMLNYKSQARENTKHILVPNKLWRPQLLDIWIPVQTLWNEPGHDSDYNSAPIFHVCFCILWFARLSVLLLGHALINRKKKVSFTLLFPIERTGNLFERKQNKTNKNPWLIYPFIPSS